LAIASGTRLGPYEISAQIGSGGMGEVYKARDTRLNRVVAIKVLPSHLADKPELKQRFEQEARAIAALNHPHICVLHDIGHQDGINYLVMEYLKGETLAQRLRKGPLPIDQVIRYGMEIADALDKAHRQGVVHRDLKPGNIMVTKSGTKLLDFGLAKLREPVATAASAALSEMPTKPMDLTDERTIVGTLHYMAPEQLEGKKADARSDLFAFGAVVYEMATARKAFEGNSAASVIASVLSSEPAPASTLQPMTPPLLEYLVKTCLRKDPDERCQTAQDVLLQLQFLVESGTQAAVTAPEGKARKRRLLVTAMIVLIAALGFGVGAVYFRRSPERMEAIRFSFSPPEPTKGFPVDPAFFAVSSDGHHLAFEAQDSFGKSSLWVRSLDSDVARRLQGTDEARRPSWSPDSRFIAFSAYGKLKKVDISGGLPQTICDIPSSTVANVTWGREEVIVFGDVQTGLLYSVSAAGGSPKLATLDQSRKNRSQLYPYFLPDGRHFLYLTISEKPEESGVYIGSPDSEGKRLLPNVASYTAYAPPGYLLYEAGGSLMSQPFDAMTLRLNGEPFRIVERVSTRGDSNRGAFSASQTGVLAYRGGNVLLKRLTWLDRTGKPLESLGEPAEYGGFEISPDEKRIAAVRSSSSHNSDIWIMDLSRGTNTRFTSDAGFAFNPLWSPDSREIVFASTRDHPANLYDNFYRKRSSGSDEEQALLKIDNVRIHQHPTDWSLDGRYILFDRSESEGTSTFDLWVLPLFGDRIPFAFLKTKFDEQGAAFSADARWVAYASNESGRYEVYVRPFAKSDGKWQISTNGGDEPKWAGGGQELFYADLNQNLMAVPIKTSPKFEAGVPKVLFEIKGRIRGLTSYAPSADGRRFLISADVENSNIATPITVVVNWTSELKK